MGNLIWVVILNMIPYNVVKEPQAVKKVCREGPEGVKWDWDWPKCGKMGFDPLGLGFLNWEWEFCFNPLSKKDFFRIKFKQKSNNSVMEFYPIKNR